MRACRIFSSVLVVLCGAVVSTATAGSPASGPGGKAIYTCKTASGKTITSDRFIRECARRDIRQLRNDGALKRNIRQPLTRAERRAIDRKRMQKRVKTMRVRQAKAQNRALIMAYPTMAALHSMRDRKLGGVQTRIEATYQRMIKLHRQLKSTQSAALAYPTGKAPSALSRKLTKIASTILAEDSLVKSHLFEQEQIRMQFAADAARLQQLLQRQSEGDRVASR